MKTRTHIKTALTALFMTMALPVAAYAPSTQKSAIIVFTGNDARVEKGLRLYMAGMGATLFITGIDEQRDARDLLRAYDIPQTRDLAGIVFDRDARDTVENARNANAWMKRQNISDAILVTGDFHVNRSLADLQKYDPAPVRMSVCPTLEPQSESATAAENLKYLAAAMMPAALIPESRETRALVSATLTRIAAYQPRFFAPAKKPAHPC